MAAQKRILLVDDDASIQKVYSKRLEVAGYEVVQAMDGEEALAKARQGKLDLIILDIMMPKLNGYEVCAQLKQDPATKAIPIIMFTAKGQLQEHVVGLMFGADAYISKVARSDVLLESIKQFLPSS